MPLRLIRRRHRRPHSARRTRNGTVCQHRTRCKRCRAGDG